MLFSQFPEWMWVTAVQVATVWTDPSSPRNIDVPGTASPANIPIWKENLTHEASLALCEENRIQTQLLYAEPVKLIAIQQDWAQIVTPSQPSKKDVRGYPGWVPLRQLQKVNRQTWQTDYYAVITAAETWLENEAGASVIQLSYQTCLPVIATEGDSVEVQTPHGKLYAAKQDIAVRPSEQHMVQENGDAIVQAGEQFTGLPYFWGGMSSFGYDCSGLAYTAHKANGYLIGRDTSDQIMGGVHIPEKERKPGDLLFFAYEKGKGELHHVGIYYGDNKLLHAPQTGKGVEVIDLEGTVYEKELCAIRRYWKAEAKTE